MSEKPNGLSEKADAAFRETTATVIQRAKQTGTPVVVWEDGRVREVPGEKWELSESQRAAETPAS